MRHLKLTALFGAACLVLFLIATLPARILSGPAADLGVTLINPTGTVWSGAATALAGSGLSLQQPSWQLRPLALLTGRLGGTVEAELSGGFIRVTGATSASGDARITELEAAGPLGPLASVLGLPTAGGEYSARLSLLEISGGWPVAAVGEIRLGNIPLGLTRDAPGTGSFAADFQQSEPAERLVGELKDLGGALEVSGSLVLSRPRSYEVSGKARARADAPAQIREALVLLGPQDAQGRRDFSLAGTL